MPRNLANHVFHKFPWQIFARHSTQFSLWWLMICKKNTFSHLLNKSKMQSKLISRTRSQVSTLRVYQKCLGMILIMNLYPVWHDVGKQEKGSSLEPPRGNFYKAQWAVQGVKITQLMSIFTPKKVWKFWKKSADKIWQGDKNVPPPYT